MAIVHGLLLLLPYRNTLVTSLILYSIITITVIVPVPCNAKPIEDEFESKELQTRTASQCFHVQGVPVINLRCGRGEFIRVIQAFYGASDRDDLDKDEVARSATCAYSSEDCVQYTSLKGACIGKSVCTVSVSNPFLSNCEQYASYMQINYTCVPRVRIHDICEQTEVTTWLGYIATPRYPSPYIANARCQCSLKTQDRSILLSILDFSLRVNSRKATGKCTDDRLHIEGWGDKCNPIVPEGLPETLGLREQALTLTFETDERLQGRGFWLEFRGSNGGKVTMTCGQRPSPSPTTDTNNNDNSHNDHNNNLTPPNPDNRWESASSDNENTTDFEDTTDNNVVLVDDGEPYRPPPDSGRPPPEEIDNEFDTYDFTDHADQYQLYNVGDVQLATGIVVSVLILVAVIIIIVLVFRR